jgi:hypothetical protein
VALWVLTFFTLGIWGVVWSYQVNRELRDYSSAVTRPFRNLPWLAAVAFALWPLAWFPLVLTAFFTAHRVRTVQSWSGDEGVSRVLAAVLSVLLFLHVLYLQRALNDAWKDAQRTGPPSQDYTVASGEAEHLVERTRAKTDESWGRYR